MAQKHRQLHTQQKKQPIYDYYLPDDEIRIKREAIVNGAVHCTREYNNKGATKANIQQNVFLSCAQVQASPKNDVFTNDFETLTQLTIYYFTESYLQMQSLYCAAPQILEEARSHFKTHGTEGIIHYLSVSGHLEALFKALEVN